MSWHPSRGDGKQYSSDMFRGTWDVNTRRDVAGPRRHIFDCELAAAAAAYSRGPGMNDSTVSGIASLMATRNNCNSYSSASSNRRDLSAANLVLQSAHTGQRVELSAHQAAHIRDGASWLHANRDSLPRGFVRSSLSLYDNVYDQSGHKVVDKRSFRGF